MFDINIEIELKEPQLNEALFENYLNLVTQALEVEDNFSFNIVSEEDIKNLNKEYRDKDESTDVLTFRLEDDDSFPVFEEEEKELGDIFLCIEKAQENANSFGVSLEEELLRLSIHGVLHLLGYDHATNDFTTEPMLVKQEALLLSLKPKLSL